MLIPTRKANRRRMYGITAILITICVLGWVGPKVSLTRGLEGPHVG
jgi:hypothetical protein